MPAIFIIVLTYNIYFSITLQYFLSVLVFSSIK